MNPNGRIPVLTDTRTKRNGEHSNGLVTIFETGAILTYLAEEYDLMSKFSYRLQQAKGDTFTDPQYVTNYWDQVNWLMFQISDHSPVQGQLSTFQNLSKQLKSYNRINEAEEFELAANWYKDETVRVFQIYEDRLIQNNGWLVGQGLNIVDISAYPWIIRAKVSKTVEFDQFPEILQWVDKLEMFEKVRKGMQIG
jgi:glutathione S-transferase